MSPEPTPQKKLRSDAALKNQPDNVQEEIVAAARTQSNQAVSEWLAKEKKINVSASTVSRFLGWFRVYRQGNRNEGTNEALHDLGKTTGQFLEETFVDQQDATAWHQSQRIALRREELELKRKTFERDSCEWVIKTYNDPKIRALAQADDKSYADKLAQLRKIMFGDE